MAEKKEKKYIIENSALMAEWNYEKNAEINLFPNKVSFGSKIKAWWTCPVCKNDYQCRISHKVAGIGCSVCAGKTVIVGYNDFLSTAPQEILAYWDYEKIDIEYIKKGIHSGL